MATKTKAPIDETQQIPELADEKDAALINAAKRYYQNKKQVSEAHSDLQASRDAVCKLMRDRGMEKYRYREIEILIDKSEKAKVKITQPKESGDEEKE